MIKSKRAPPSRPHRAGYAESSVRYIILFICSEHGDGKTPWRRL